MTLGNPGTTVPAPSVLPEANPHYFSALVARDAYSGTEVEGILPLVVVALVRERTEALFEEAYDFRITRYDWIHHFSRGEDSRPYHSTAPKNPPSGQVTASQVRGVRLVLTFRKRRASLVGGGTLPFAVMCGAIPRIDCTPPEANSRCFLASSSLVASRDAYSDIEAMINHSVGQEHCITDADEWSFLSSLNTTNPRKNQNSVVNRIRGEREPVMNNSNHFLGIPMTVVLLWGIRNATSGEERHLVLAVEGMKLSGMMKLRKTPEEASRRTGEDAVYVVEQFACENDTVSDTIITNGEEEEEQRPRKSIATAVVERGGGHKLKMDLPIFNP
ncbi:uncharacterized protein EV420DRAFT_1484872 [Desarmillaria tabescens]|uniref:Uncharacterized protein n=1 Tax=Armillaria tabescens TaxID=1929756 RepID=A0AA39JIY9_ARMTA|nr:uncharacterized protein EV420DRAFT_1484872 [Desarmillaria tabescens]KAK0443647.1 hypothetical protein EV420DRAFT_1484872 [Desarmillaria tabescens]